MFERGTGDLSREPGGDAQKPLPADVRGELDKALTGETFVHSPQLCRFLRFIVEQELEGKGEELKEYVLGVQVLRKGESFDPRIDTAVRTEARRLRQKLAEYYQSEGRNDLVEIGLPKGSYRPVFQRRASVAPASKTSRVPAIRIAAAVVLVLIGALAWWFWKRTGYGARAPSIAIIPLENLSSDPEQEYFSDGMTDALFTDLAKFHGLSVISRTSMTQYKRTKKPIPQIASELKVDYVVEGTVIHAGERVRISAQLIAAPSDRHIWAESYERSAADVLGLQGEIARTIANQVHIHVTPQEQLRISGRPVSVEAQDLYLKGRFNWQTRDTSRMLKSLDYFNQAILKEPGYALAYAGLADAYNVLSYRMDRKDYRAQSCEAANKALSLDDNLGEAHASLDGCIDLWDWQQREMHLRRAVELSPSYPTAHQWFGAMLIDTGRDQQGLAEVRRAAELDPLGPSPNNALCMSLYMTRQYDQAIQHCLQTLEVFPGYLEPYYGLGFAYTAKGMYPQAIGVLEKAMTLSDGAPQVATILAHARAWAGDRTAAARLIQQYSARRDVPPIMLAALYLDAGDKDHAFEYLIGAVEQRSFGSDWIKVNPGLDSLHSDVRWAALLRKMNLSN